MEVEAKYLLQLTDGDFDMLTLHQPESYGGDYMLRIHNDDQITGFIIDGPAAMALIGVLTPIARDFKIDEYLNLEME